MHFGTKSTLKSNHNRTSKHALSQLDWIISSQTLYFLIFFLENMLIIIKLFNENFLFISMIHQ
jgi:hypothetical protein